MKKILPLYLFMLAYVISIYFNETKTTVTSSVNPGAGTLRNVATIVASNDTIMLSPGLSGSTITFRKYFTNQEC